jgi:hypothetical protein
MITNYDENCTHEAGNPVNLHQLVDQLMVTFLPRAVRQNSFMVNHVQEKMPVIADKNVLASVLGNLLYNTVALTSNNCIQVSAKTYSNITLIHIRKSDICYEEEIVKSFQPIQALAEKLGGCISVTCNKVKGTTVAFTFLNVAEAA